MYIYIYIIKNFDKADILITYIYTFSKNLNIYCISIYIK